MQDCKLSHMYNDTSFSFRLGRVSGLSGTVRVGVSAGALLWAFDNGLDDIFRRGFIKPAELIYSASKTRPTP